MTTARTWSAALDDLEQRLTAHRALLAVGGEQPPAAAPWTPPPDLGPVPDSCLPRARALLQQLHEVVQLLAQARSCARRERRLHRALPSARSAGASYVDVRG